MRRAHRQDMTDHRFWSDARVPGSVLDDAWRAGLARNPYRDRNSLLDEWVPARTWVYRRTFTAPPTSPRAELRFESIDPAATIFLNGEELGRHEGLYSKARFEAGDCLRWGDENLLAVVLERAPFEQPQVGRTSLVRHFRPRFSEGWDFCPRLPHQGMGGVELWTGGDARIDDVWVRASPEELRYSVASSLPAEITVDAARATATGPEGSMPHELEAWWPNGCGPQPLHRLTATCKAGGWEDVVSVTFGVRSLDLVQNQAAPISARPYTLEVNGRLIYMRGLNWVPLDVVYGVPRRRRLRRLLGLARHAGVNLLRVWGGGLIEGRDFYDLCDRLGILVWQEFSLSSSMLDNRPASDPGFLSAIDREARAAIRARRHHPSLALWCGGNELAEAGGVPLDETEPALATLRRAVADLDPDRPFLPSSPSGPTFGNDIAAIEAEPDSLHDVHGPWEHQGLEAQHSLWNRGTSLLVSEFGAEGISNLRTLRRYVTEPLWPATRDNPAWTHRGDWFINEARVQACFGGIGDLETLARASQLLQAHGLRTALEANRRRWPRNSGSIPWHFNEPFPAGYSTSVVDYATHPKLAYYAVRAAYRPLLLAATLARTAWPGEGEFDAEPWVSSWAGAGEGRLEARLLGSDGRTLAEWESRLSWPSNGTATATPLSCDLSCIPPGLFHLELRLGEVAAARYLLARGDDLRALRELPPARLAAEVARDSLVVANIGSVVAVDVRVEEPGALPSALIEDSGFSLLPGESRSLAVGWPGRPGRLSVHAWNTDAVEV